MRPLLREAVTQSFGVTEPISVLLDSFGKYCGICELPLFEEPTVWQPAAGHLWSYLAATPPEPESILLCRTCAATQATPAEQEEAQDVGDPALPFDSWVVYPSFHAESGGPGFRHLGPLVLADDEAATQTLRSFRLDGTLLRDPRRWSRARAREAAALGLQLVADEADGPGWQEVPPAVASWITTTMRMTGFLSTWLTVLLQGELRGRAAALAGPNPERQVRSEIWSSTTGTVLARMQEGDSEVVRMVLEASERVPGFFPGTDWSRTLPGV